MLDPSYRPFRIYRPLRWKSEGVVASTITLQKNWGFMDVDKFSVYTMLPNVYNITPNLVDPLATAATNCLYSYLVSQFGTKVISGQTNDYYDALLMMMLMSMMLLSLSYS